MNQLKSYWILPLIVMASVLMPGRVSAQSSETLIISGTFQTYYSQGTLGTDLANVSANGYDHGWILTLQGITDEQDYLYEDWLDFNGDYSYSEQHITRIRATAFTLEFVGPDSDVLNSVVSSQLTSGGLTGGAVVELINLDYQEPFNWESGPYTILSIRLSPTDVDNGVSFICESVEYGFLPADLEGYPLIGQFRAYPTVSCQDLRANYPGWLGLQTGIVDFGSSVIPPFTPKIAIADASILEGNKGSTRVNVVVTLSSASSQNVTVQYRTVAGTAIARNDYTATSGSVTFMPGQTSRTVSVDIKADRKREPDEFFTVLLSNPTVAPLAKSEAIVTILNDD